MKIIILKEAIDKEFITKNRNLLEYNTDMLIKNGFQKDDILYNTIKGTDMRNWAIVILSNIFIENFSALKNIKKDLAFKNENGEEWMYVIWKESKIKEPNIYSIKEYCNNINEYQELRWKKSFILINSKKKLQESRKQIALNKNNDAYIHCPHVSLPAKIFYNYFAFPITRKILKYNVTPNQISSFSFFLTIIWILLLLKWDYKLMIISLLFLHIGFVFDCVDWWLARIKILWSNFGWFVDSSFDSIKMTLLIMWISIYELGNNENFIFLALLLFAIKYTNTTIYSNATHFSKSTLSTDFVPQEWVLSKIMKKLNLEPQHLTLSNDVLLIFFSLGLVFNISNMIFIMLIMFYILQLSVFLFITWKRLKNETNK